MKILAADLVPMSDAELLEYVKKSANITGTYQNDTLTGYIGGVKFYLQGAGVSCADDFDVLNSTLAASCIARGTLDTWNYGNGDSKFSDLFYELAEHLRCVEELVVDE